MKNEIGFINKKYTQPVFYRNIGGNWAAIYLIGDKEYHIQAVSSYYDIKREFIETFDVLKKMKSGRIDVQGCGSTYRTVKMAVEVIDNLIHTNNKAEESMKKFIMAESVGNNSYKIVVVDGKGDKTLLNGMSKSENNLITERGE